MDRLVFLCFVLSGASGLLFEVLWTRELGLVFGSTTLAMSTVLSAFMGGLALGSYLGGRLCGRPWLRRPLVAYALVEAGVGLFALVLPRLLSHYPRLNALLWQTVGDHPVLLSLLRFALTALLLLLPTMLMGASLPLLSEHLTRRHATRSSTQGRPAAMDIGALFAANTVGAVLGTFASGFLLLPRLGIARTNYVGAGINLSLAVAILLAEFLMSQRRERAPSLADLEVEVDPNPTAEGNGPGPLFALPSRATRQVAIACYAISGAAAMVYQVLWTRALAVVIGSSAYSFTLILLAFLSGLAGGSAVATRLIPRIERPVRALALVHALTLGTALWSFYILPRLPHVFMDLLRGSSFTVDELLTSQFVLAALSILPATLAMGAVMPLTMHVYTLRERTTRAAQTIGQDVGTAYAANTLGAIGGSFAAGFLVMPELGLQRGLMACAIVTALLSATLYLLTHRELGVEGAPRARRLPGMVRAGVVLGIAAVAVGLLPRWNLSHFSTGLFRIALAKQLIESKQAPVPELLYYRDGVSTTVSVERFGKHLALKNNGKVDASNGDDMGTQIMVGLLPLLFHPTALVRPPRVAVVGYGSGVTVGAVTQFPIGHADVVELEAAVLEAGDRFFADVSHHPSRDPRVRVLIGDGRNFMTQSNRRYDVIISEPSNPWIAGVSSLFTTDYWRLARSRLADDGVFCQWAQLYELSQTNVKSLLKSFSSVFPYSYVFAAEHRSSDVLLIASPRPLPLDVQRLAQNFADPRLKAELLRAGISRPEEILADLLLVPDELPAYTAGATLNTDDNAYIEFRAPRDLLGYMRNDLTVAKVYNARWPYAQFERYLVGHGDPLVTGPGSRATFYAELGRALLRHGKRPAAERLLRRSMAVGGGDEADRLRDLLALLAEPNSRGLGEPLTATWDGSALHFADGLLPDVLPPASLLASKHMDAQQVTDAVKRSLELLSKQDYAAALRPFRDWPMSWIVAMGPKMRLLLGYLLWKVELPEEARDHLSEILDDPNSAAFLRQFPGTLYYLSHAEQKCFDPQASSHHADQYLDLRKAGQASEPQTP